MIDDGLIDASVSKKIAAKNKRLRDRDLGDIRKVLSTPEGRRFFWRILSKCGIFHASWSGDTNQTLVNEGRREIGLIFLDDLMEASPQSFVQLQREAKGLAGEKDE